MLSSNCNYCNKEIVYHPSQYRGKYCSKSCEGLHRTQKAINRVEYGKTNCPRTMKRYLTEKRGYKCESCNISTWLDKLLSLHLDHIDGNANNCLPSNIRLLCPNCHSQTPTYGGKNKINSVRATYQRQYRVKKLKLV